MPVLLARKERVCVSVARVVNTLLSAQWEQTFTFVSFYSMWELRKSHDHISITERSRQSETNDTSVNGSERMWDFQKTTKGTAWSPGLINTDKLLPELLHIYSRTPVTLFFNICSVFMGESLIKCVSCQVCQSKPVVWTATLSCPVFVAWSDGYE